MNERQNLPSSPPLHGASYFQGSHNFGIDNAHFVNNQITHIHQSSSRDPASVLDEHRAVEATHKSTTAEYAPKCNPKTRREVIDDLTRWIEGTRPPKSVLWFNGPAGAGKTCIMREVMARCISLTNTIALSYFFSSRIAGLNNANPFVATIAHQLAYMGFPVLKQSILDAITDHPFVFKDGLEAQAEGLLFRPLQDLGPSSGLESQKRVVLLIDGLDECRDESQRKHLISLLLSLARRLAPFFVVVIASRPEVDIRMRFDDPATAEATHTIQLQDYEGTEDVRIFYCDEFARIRACHPLRKYIPADWPTEETLSNLINKSSGHFIYPSTIIKYISQNPRRNPVEILQQALTATAIDQGPLTELDALYRTILHPPGVDIPLLKRLLHSIMIVSMFDPISLNALLLDEMFELPQGTTEATLCDLHSVLNVDTSDSQRMTFHHKSLEDFLLSHMRSQDLYQHPIDTLSDIFIACMRIHKTGVRSEPTTQHCERYLFGYLEMLLEIAQNAGVHLRQEILEFDYEEVIVSSRFPYIQEILHRTQVRSSVTSKG